MKRFLKHFNKQFIDECDDISLCPKHDSTCINTIGSFECSCNDGFERNGDICENINECDVPANQNPCLSKLHSTCRDIHGSFECECNSGYEKDTTDDDCRVIEQTPECPENSQLEGHRKGTLVKLPRENSLRLIGHSVNNKIFE